MGFRPGSHHGLLCIYILKVHLLMGALALRAAGDETQWSALTIEPQVAPERRLPPKPAIH